MIVPDPYNNSKNRLIVIAKCPICDSPAALHKHLPLCPSARNIQEKPTFFRVPDYGCVCKKCWQLFTEEKWVHHRKTNCCNKNAKLKEKPQTQFSLSSDHSLPHSLPSRLNDQPRSSPSSISNYSNLSDIVRVRLSETDRMTDLFNIVINVILPLIKDWANQYPNISVGILVAHVTAATVEFWNSFISRPVVVPTWDIITTKGGKDISWHSFLEQPDNLFNNSFLNQKL